MESFYYIVFSMLLVLCGGLELLKKAPKGTGGGDEAKKEGKGGSSSAFTAFRNNYLVVYSLMMAADWLQGPYVYALYSHYGYTKGDIGKLFIAGFGSSMIFGTFIGSMADRYGRKKCSLLYVVTYVISCITKHSPNYWVLMFGRFTGGIATSLLFSAFESWLVAEHFKRGFDSAQLSGIFSKAVFLGNGLMAIVSGLGAQFLISTCDFGPVAPFDASMTVLLIGGAVVQYTWPENYGDSTGTVSIGAQFQKAAQAIMSDQKIAILGAMQSLFEGSMYTFVFLWTPALQPRGEDIPHGFIFATFMLACMCGSSFTSRLMTKSVPPPEKYMQYVFVAASFALLLPVWFSVSDLANTEASADAGGITFNGQVQLFGFLIFEACVGIFWPSIMSMRSKYLPEESRSTIMNFFRIPLNLFVCIVLYNVSMFPLGTMFAMCSTFLLVAAACQYRLFQLAVAQDLIYSSKVDDTI